MEQSSSTSRRSRITREPYAPSITQSPAEPIAPSLLDGRFDIAVRRSARDVEGLGAHRRAPAGIVLRSDDGSESCLAAALATATTAS